MRGSVLLTKGWLLLAIGLLACSLAAAQTRAGNGKEYLEQGNQFAKQQKWQEAEKAYSNAVNLAPNSAPAHYGLGNALAAQQDVGNAIREYQRALQLDPKLEGIHRSLGALFESIGQLTQALEEYRAELARHPNDASTGPRTGAPDGVMPADPGSLRTTGRNGGNPPAASGADRNDREAGSFDAIDFHWSHRGR